MNLIIMEGIKHYPFYFEMQEYELELERKACDSEK